MCASFLAESDYQFVVICTSENEFNAHMTAALEKYMRQPPVPTNPEKVLAYLKSKFIVPTDVLPINSAACVDPERLFLCIYIMLLKNLLSFV